MLQAKAAAEGLSLAEWIAKLAQTDQQPAKDTASHKDTPRHIWDIIADNMKDVPAEDFAALPKDGLSQIDHYVYGTPKRTNERALTVSRSITPDRIVTTDEVLVEYLTFFSGCNSGQHSKYRAPA